MDNEDIILQRDRSTARDLNQMPGVDGNKYSLGQLRVLEKVKAMALEYKDAAVKGAVMGAVGGSVVPGIGTGIGALVGMFAGIGYRAYGAPADAVDAALTRLEGDLEEEMNN